MHADMNPVSDVNGSGAESPTPATPTLPLSIDVPSGYHAIVTTAFYGGNQKAVTVSAVESSQTWVIPHAVDKPGCDVLPFAPSTFESDTLSINASCLTRPSSGSPEPMTPIALTWTGGGTSGNPSAHTLLAIYAADPMEAVGITIVVQVGSGPATGPGQ